MRVFLIMFALVIVSLPAHMPTSHAAADTKNDETHSFAINPVVLRGDPTSDGGRFFDCDSCEASIAGDRGLNDLGQVVIFGFTSKCSGLYIVSGRTGTLVADVCRQTPFGRFSLYAGANINNQGHVALNMGPAINNTVVDMILLYSNGQLQKIVAEGERGPTGSLFGYCGFSRPGINNVDEIAFSSCFQDDQGNFGGNGIFAYSGGQLRKIAVGHDPSPVGGQFAFTLVPPPRVAINDKGDVLFGAGQYDPDSNDPERFGLFMATSQGMQKIELGRDTMPNGSKAADNSIGGGKVNNNGDVVFGLRLAGKPRVGIFLYSGGATSTVILDRQNTPTGGTYNLTQEAEDTFGARINDNGTVAFMANVTGGSSSEAIFLASPKAVLKVIGIGDRLPTGEKIRSINSFALNNLGQVAFFANGSSSVLNNMPLGVFLATPVPPTITAIKLKQKKSGLLMLCVDGGGMIANDTVIEINGVPLSELSYPTEFQENGGTTTRVMSRDSRIDQMMQSGQPVQVTLYNSLTNLRSAAVTFTR